MHSEIAGDEIQSRSDRVGIRNSRRRRCSVFPLKTACEEKACLLRRHAAAESDYYRASAVQAQEGESAPLVGFFGRFDKERGLSQEQLGFDSGYHRTYISFLEPGKKNPTLSTVFDLAETLRMPAWELIREVEALLK
jgi:DNA-binding XRE family transcriptional regulator